MDKNNSEITDSSINTEDVASSDSDNYCLLDTIMMQPKQKESYIVAKEDRITKNKLTRYEFVRIIGERTKQLMMGAKPLIKVKQESEELSYNEIAIEELKLKMIPFKIKRPINNNFEIWQLDELDHSHLVSLF